MNTNAHTHFNNFLSSALNETQKQAVTPKNGLLLVRAGAGSGKTRVITSRIAHLMLNHGVEAHEILALTFTNKAAREMKERVSSFLQTTALPFVGTFHSYCLRLLKQHAYLLSHAQFSLLDDSDQEKIIKALLQKNGLIKKVAVRQVLSFISRVKNETTTESERESVWEHNIVLRDLYYLYEQEKKIAHCFDFDDLLLETLALFDKHSDFKQKFQQQVRHILIDEYQDTNKVQHALLKAMTQSDTSAFALDSLCVVGDEDQSIYSWRGATVTNIMNFSREFPQTQIVTIEQNYRSVQPILHIANEVIKHNTGRSPKNLWSEKVASDRIRLLAYSSSYQEAEACALFLKQSSTKNSLNSHAILYRSHYQSRALEEALIRHSIAYKIMGGIQFYDRQEIKDLLAYLKLIINPYDRIAFSRVINIPARGLGDKFEELFFSNWHNQPFLSFIDIAQNLLSSNQLTRTKQEALAEFIDIFQGLTPLDKASDVLTVIIQKTAYYTYLKELFDKEEADIKKDNIKELINGALYFEENTQQNLEIFLQEIALLQEHMNITQETTQDYVTLMTLHAAKGLEFDTVLLPGIEEGVLPSAHSLYQPETLEEERRLLYVGITRARERLLISYTRYRTTYGQMTEQRPSRFIEELPEIYIQKSECSYWTQQHFTTYFHDWLNHVKPSQALQSSQVAEKTTRIEVNHATFGRGTIEQTERRGDKTFYTIRFKNCTKKIESSFVQ